MAIPTQLTEVKLAPVHPLLTRLNTDVKGCRACAEGRLLVEMLSELCNDLLSGPLPSYKLHVLIQNFLHDPTQEAWELCKSQWHDERHQRSPDPAPGTSEQPDEHE